MEGFIEHTPTPVVEVSWLQENIDAKNLVVFDASVPPVVPGFESINKEGDFKAIPGARRFDYDKKICKPDSALPHMMPSPELFTRHVRELGLNKDSVVVVYDDVGLYASPRAWWMLKAMGFDRVAVLNGGLPAWIEAGNKVLNHLAVDVPTGDFNGVLRPDLFCDFEKVLNALSDERYRIVDARSSARFNGTAPEPRVGSRSGHMPNAANLPFAQVLVSGKLKPVSEIAPLFDAIASPDETLITSCGSGITACVLTLAAYSAGFKNLSVYDGSWAEWGAPGKLPVVTD